MLDWMKDKMGAKQSHLQRSRGGGVSYKDDEEGKNGRCSSSSARKTGRRAKSSFPSSRTRRPCIQSRAADALPDAGNP